MSDMKAYLAQKYMSGPKADAILARSAPKKKKRKTNTATATSGVSLVKDDDGGWGDEQTRDDPDEAAEAVVEVSDRSFKKRKREGEPDSGWAVDEKPQVVETDTPFAGGLVSAKQLKKVLPQTALADNSLTAEEIAKAQETVYRDATGRKIDTKAARAEAARKKRELEEKEAQKMEWGKGLVQRDEAEQNKKELEKQRNKKGFRHADDEDLNEELRAKELWNDPAAAFLTKKKSKGPKLPQYNGPPPPPNRFGIRPGYRWDGVDRSNGFEKKFFQNQNAKKRRGLESYQWSAEDM
ncbi:Pre-mRNA-splicing factor of RES complex-domain-containing protein [Mucidula mucida]|nr:Pre-mRNA-splicing factor of RES complex-domain-containing protein [Mucidula mucida]